jgi:hypothetical protein
VAAACGRPEWMTAARRLGPRVAGAGARAHPRRVLASRLPVVGRPQPTWAVSADAVMAGGSHPSYALATRYGTITSIGPGTAGAGGRRLGRVLAEPADSGLTRLEELRPWRWRRRR